MYASNNQDRLLKNVYENGEQILFTGKQNFWMILSKKFLKCLTYLHFYKLRENHQK